MVDVKAKEDERMKSEHINLLENLGTISKYKREYFPKDISIIELLIKSKFDSDMVNSYYTKGITVPENPISKNINVHEITRYRNNILLDDRNECILLDDWFTKMQLDYCPKNEGGSSLRNNQIILSFVISEIERMTRIECNNRADLLHKVWIETAKLMKDIEQESAKIERNECSKEMGIHKKIRRELEKELDNVRKEIAQLRKTDKEYLNEINTKEWEIQRLKQKIKSLNERYTVISKIMDHLLAKEYIEIENEEKNFQREVRQMAKKLNKKINSDRSIKIHNSTNSIDDPLLEIPKESVTNTKVKTDEIGRASCRERVYVLV